MLLAGVVICKFEIAHLVRVILYFIISPTEIWSLTDEDEIANINIAEPFLKNYSYFPEIFLVNSDFCTRN